MLVNVIDVRGLEIPEGRANVVYVGRAHAGWPGHKLGNPFKLIGGSPEERAYVIERYRAWLLARPTLGRDLDELWDATGHGGAPLGCWCHPKPCHADVLAELLTARFAGRG